MSTVIGQFSCRVLLYGMRSCKYSKVDRPPKTKILRIWDFEFHYNGSVIPMVEGKLKFATTVSVNILNQKVDRSNRVTISGIHDISELGSATTWNAVIERVLSHTGITLDSPINLVQIG